MATNLEIKVKCNEEELALVRDRAMRMGISQFENLHQIDTYFQTPSGRLKLREISQDDRAENSELIGYHRPDEAGSRWSRYTRAEIDPEQTAAVKEALAETLGIWQIVDKRRVVCIWMRTRIHLDLVEGLGAFVELETVTGRDADPSADAELQSVAQSLGLDQFAIIAGSYSDLMAAIR